MTLGLLVALENADKQTHRQARFMYYKYRYLYVYCIQCRVYYTEIKERMKQGR